MKKVFTKKQVARLGAGLVCSIYLGLGLLTPVMVQAQMSWDDVLSIVKNRAYYRKQCGGGNNSSSAKQTGIATGKLYMIGDSITQGTNGQLNTTLTARGFTQVEIDGLNSRRLTAGGDPLDGIGVLERSKERIKDASVVVIALGTNGGISDASIQQTLDIIKSPDASPDANIFWVNIGARNEKRNFPALPADEWNQTLQQNAGKGYTIIDWASVVKDHADYIADDSLGVHPGGAGIQAFADTVASGVTGGAAPVSYRNIDQSFASKKDGNFFSNIKNRLVALAFPKASAIEDNSNANKGPLSLRDKIAQMLFVRVDNMEQANTAASFNVGGIYVRENQPVFNGASIKEIKGKFKITPAVTTDGEGGKVDALGAGGLAPKLPSAKEMGEMSNEEVEKLAEEYGKKMAEHGFTIDLAPVLDLDNPNNSIIGGNQRAFSADPKVVTEKALAFSRGLERAGITPVYKHFPGHGNADGDSHQGAVTTPPLDQLKENDLKPYEDIAQNASIIMMGHLNVPGLGDENLPASINPDAINLLRTDYKFKGLVMTDDLIGMKAISDLGLTQGQALEKAILAGENVLLTNADIDINAVLGYLELQAATNPELTKQIDESANRIINFKGVQLNQDSEDDGSCSCSATGSNSMSGGSTELPSDLRGADNAEKIFNFFTDAKYDPTVAAGFIGNMMAESGLNPRALEPGTTGDAPIAGRGYGLVQWTFPDRQDPLKMQAGAKGKDVFDLKLQLEYVVWELENKFQGVHERLKNIQQETPREGTELVDKATEIIEIHYETHAGIHRDRPETPEHQAFQQSRKDTAREMLAKFGSGSGSSQVSGSKRCAKSVSGNGQTVGGFSLPLEKKWYDQNPVWFTKPHHSGRAASDIPVPTGTPVFSMTKGKVLLAPNEGGYGRGVTIDAGNGIIISYGHGRDGGAVKGAQQGDEVEAGQLIMHSASTGNSTGPHLHVDIRVNGKVVCPQPLFVAIAEGGEIPRIEDLPTTGCF